MAEQPALDAAQLLGALSRHGVDCVLIGGVAVQAYGHVRTTLDLDVIAAWTPENMRRLAGALGDLDARLRGVDAELLGIDLTDPRQLYEGGTFLMRTRHGDLDVFALEQTAGAPRSYEQLRARAVAVEVLGARILVAHPEDLIRMKTAASQVRERPEPKRRQDLDDVAVLERIRSRQEQTAALRTALAARPPQTTPPSAPDQAPAAQPSKPAGTQPSHRRRRR